MRRHHRVTDATPHRGTHRDARGTRRARTHGRFPQSPILAKEPSPRPRPRPDPRVTLWHSPFPGPSTPPSHRAWKPGSGAFLQLCPSPPLRGDCRPRGHAQPEPVPLPGGAAGTRDPEVPCRAAAPASWAPAWASAGPLPCRCGHLWAQGFWGREGCAGRGWGPKGQAGLLPGLTWWPGRHAGPALQVGVKTGVSGEWAGASPATGLARPHTSHVRAESRWVFPDRQLGPVALGCGPSGTSADESRAAIRPPCWGQGAPSCQGGLSKHLWGSLAPLLRQTHRETGSSTLHGTSPWREATSSPRRGGAQALRRAQRGTWHPPPPQPLSLHLLPRDDPRRLLCPARAWGSGAPCAQPCEASSVPTRGPHVTLGPHNGSLGREVTSSHGSALSSLPLPTCWLQARPAQGCPRISLKRRVREPPLRCAGTRLLSRENVPSPRGQLAAAATGPRPPAPTLRRPRLPARAARTRAGRATGRSRAQGEHLRVSRRDGRAPGQHRALAFGSY